MTTILEALKQDHIERAKTLILQRETINQQDEIGYSALHLATLKGHTDLIHALLEAGANPNIKTFTDNSYQEEEDILITDKLIRNLSKLGNKTPLHIAAKENFIEIGKLLLAYGADCHIVDAGLCTPLHWCSAKGYAVFSELLLKNHANPNAKDLANSTPLHEACRNYHLDIVALLLRHKADDAIADITGATARKLAESNAEILKVFNQNSCQSLANILH